MDQNNIAAMRDNYHDYRRLMQVRALDTEQTGGDLIIEGTPVIFDQPYLLFEWGGKKVYEVIESGAFDEADYRDVPLKYNHGDSRGVPARTTSKGPVGKLEITVMQDHVGMRANLIKTTGGQDLYLEVASGTVPQMSWAFTTEPDSEKIVEDGESITFYVRKVKRVFDVSAVDFGANPNTTIFARRCNDLDERAAALDERRRQAIVDRINKILRKENNEQ